MGHRIESTPAGAQSTARRAVVSSLGIRTGSPMARTLVISGEYSSQLQPMAVATWISHNRERESSGARALPPDPYARHELATYPRSIDDELDRKRWTFSRGNNAAKAEDGSVEPDDWPRVVSSRIRSDLTDQSG